MAIPSLESIIDTSTTDPEKASNEGFIVPQIDSSENKEEVQVASLGFVNPQDMGETTEKDVSEELVIPDDGTAEVKTEPVIPEIQVAQAPTTTAPAESDGGFADFARQQLLEAEKRKLFLEPKAIPTLTTQRLLTTGKLGEQRAYTHYRQKRLYDEREPTNLSWSSVGDIYDNVSKLPDFLGLEKNEKDNLYSLITEFPEAFEGISDATLMGLRKVIGSDTPEMLRLGFTGILMMANMDYVGQKILHEQINASAIAHNDSFYTNEIAPLSGFLNTKEFAKQEKFYNIVVDGKPKLVDRADYIKDVFDNNGVTALFRGWADNIAGGSNMNEADMTYLERAAFYAVQFATPFTLIPFFTYAKIGQVAGRAFDKVRLARHMNKTHGEDYAEWVKKSGQLGGDFSLVKSRTHIVTGSGGKQIGAFKYKFDPHKEFEWHRYWDMTHRSIAAGLAGSSYATYAIAQYGARAFEEEYKHMPYLFAMGGYLVGAKPIGKALYRLPLATAPLTGSLLSIMPPKGLVSLTSATAQGAWALLRRQQIKGEGIDELAVGSIKRELGRGLRDIQQTKAGKILQLLTTTAPVSAILSAVTKDRKALGGPGGTKYIDATLARYTMDAKGTAAMIKAIDRMPENERELAQKGATEFYQQLERVVARHGEEGFVQDMVLMDQLFALSNLRSMRNMYIGKFESADALGTKTTSNGWFFNKKSLTSELDRIESLMHEQVSLISKDMDRRRALYKADPTSVTRGILKHADNVLISTRKDFANFEVIKNELLRETGRFANMWDRYVINYLVNTPHADGGFRVDKYITHPDFLNHRGPLNKATKDAMIQENFIRFNSDSLLAWRFASNRMRDIASKAYPEEAAMNMLIPVDNFIAKMDDSIFTQNRHVANMAGINDINNVTKEGVISFSKENYLRARGFDKEPSELIIFITGLQSMLKESKGYQIRIKGDDGVSSITGADNIFNKMLDDVANGDVTSVIEQLSKMRGTNLKTIRLLIEELPGVLRISDAHLMRMKAWDDVTSKSGSTGGNKKNKLDRAKDIDNIFKQMFNPLNKEDLSLTLRDLHAFDAKGKKIPISEEEIKKTLTRLDKANKHYEKNVGSVWETLLGRSFVPKNRTASEALNQTNLMEDRWIHLVFSKAVDDIPDSATIGHPSGIVIFNKVFSGKGPDITLRKTEDFPEQIFTSKEFREFGKALFSSSIMKKVARGDIDFLKEIDDGILMQLQKTDILSPEQVVNLQNYKRVAELAEQGLFDTRLMKINKEMTQDLSKLNEMTQNNLRQSFISQAVNDDTILTGTRLVKALFDADDARMIGLTFDDAGAEIMRLRENVAQLQRVQRAMGSRGVENIVEEAGGKLDEAYKALLEINVGSPINILLDSVGKNIAMLDGIESLIYHHIHISSIKPTNKKIPFGSSRVELKDSFGEAAEEALLAIKETSLDPLTRTTSNELSNLRKSGRTNGLQKNLDLVAMNESMAKAIPLLRAIYEKRISLGHNVSESESFLTQLREMSDVLGLGKIFRGEVQTATPRSIPSPLSLNQKQGKIYNMVRGFVSPTYLILERMAGSYGVNQARIIERVLLDPKAGRVLLDMIEKKKISRSSFKILGSAIWGAYRGNKGIEEFKSISKEQITLMYKDAMGTMHEGDLPDWYGKLGTPKRKAVISLPLNQGANQP